MIGAVRVGVRIRPSQKVKLGLDLKGGVHLVLRVKTDDALKVETDTTVERLRDTLTRAGVAFTKVEATESTEFRVDGIQDDAAFRTQAADAETVYDRSSEAGGYSYRMKPNVANQLRDETVAQALETIERRVNELGVAEPIVARYGAPRSDPGAAARRERCSARQGDHPLDGASGVEARRSGAIPESRGGAAGVQQRAARRLRGAAGTERGLGNRRDGRRGATTS